MIRKLAISALGLLLVAAAAAPHEGQARTVVETTSEQPRASTASSKPRFEPAPAPTADLVAAVFAEPLEPAFLIQVEFEVEPEPEPTPTSTPAPTPEPAPTPYLAPEQAIEGNPYVPFYGGCGAAQLTAQEVEQCAGKWAPVVWCESRGAIGALNPRDTNGLQSKGAVQFQQPTWDTVVQWAGRPDLVGVDLRTQSLQTQLHMADTLAADSGLSPWPHCGQFYGGCFTSGATVCSRS